MWLVIPAAVIIGALMYHHGNPDWLHYLLGFFTLYFAYRTWQWQRAEAETMQQALEWRDERLREDVEEIRRQREEGHDHRS